jgi:acetoin utilization deacetylase AcuC-like enzyme
LGFSDKISAGLSEGLNLNLPLADGSDMQQWCKSFEIAANKISEFDANLLIIPLGVDTFEHDPISSFKIKTADYLTMGTLIAKLQLPCVFVMEGGYDVDPIGQNMLNVLIGF